VEPVELVVGERLRVLERVRAREDVAVVVVLDARRVLERIRPLVRAVEGVIVNRARAAVGVSEAVTVA
jgi:hypothetical protein